MPTKKKIKKIKNVITDKFRLETYHIYKHIQVLKPKEPIHTNKREIKKNKLKKNVSNFRIETYQAQANHIFFFDSYLDNIKEIIYCKNNCF
jgi:hypothetical protein